MSLDTTLTMTTKDDSTGGSAEESPAAPSRMAALCGKCPHVYRRRESPLCTDYPGKWAVVKKGGTMLFGPANLFLDTSICCMEMPIDDIRGNPKADALHEYLDGAGAYLAGKVPGADLAEAIDGNPSAVRFREEARDVCPYYLEHVIFMENQQNRQ